MFASPKSVIDFKLLIFCKSADVITGVVSSASAKNLFTASAESSPLASIKSLLMTWPPAIIPVSTSNDASPDEAETSPLKKLETIGA